MSTSNPFNSPTADVVDVYSQRRTASFVIKKIDVGSCAIMMGTMYAALGLIGGAFVALLAMVGSGAGAFGVQGVVGGVLAIILAPLLYGIMGLIGGAIIAGIYNIIAGIAGGIRIETGD